MEISKGGFIVAFGPLSMFPGPLHVYLVADTIRMASEGNWVAAFSKADAIAFVRALTALTEELP